MEINDEAKFTKDIISLIQNEIQRWKIERILLLFLDNDGSLIYKKIVSFGYNKHRADFYPDDVAQLFDVVKTKAVIWSHNHVND